MTDWPPRVLSNLYRNGLQTFHALLLDLIAKALHFSEESGDCRIGAAELRTRAEERLIGDGDPPEYRTLLKKSYAVMAETVPSLGRVSFEQRWTQEQIVDRVIVLQFQQEDKPSHVLCAGYRKLRPSGVDSSQRRSPPGLECVCENSSVDIVNSPSWKILLSRVGDLIMLYVLTHAAVFSPLPNNCFLQVSGRVVSTGKSASVHPGEKMLGAAARQKWMSKSSTRQHKQIRRKLHRPSVENEEEQPVPNLGAVRNQISNFTRSTYLKRHRTESTETGVNSDVLDGYSTYSDLGKHKVGSKRQRCGSGDEGCQNGELLRPDEVGTSNDATFQFGKDSPHDMPAKHSGSNLLKVCSRRAPEETTVQFSVEKKELLDEDGNPCIYNTRKRQKLSEQIGKDRYSQEETEPNTVPDQGSADFKAVVPPKRSKITKKNIELEGGILKHETASTQLPNHDRGDSRVGQDTSASPSLVEGTSSSGKRVRLPSWKRRKLRKAQESCLTLVHKDPPLESCEEGQSGIAKRAKISQLEKPAVKVEEVITKTGKEESRLCASEFHPLHPSEKVGSVDPFADGTGGTNFGRRAPNNTPQRKKSPSDPGTTDGVSPRLIDRAPIFYNSNYSCHPGLPAKHILNSSKRDETGVVRLFSAIFGGHCKILECSASGGHMYAIHSTSKSKPGRRSQFESVHKLLKGLLSNARRCAFARLLGRHCPLPEGFHSNHNDSPLKRKSQARKTKQKRSELGKDMHQDKKPELSSPDPAPEVEEVMRLLLGQNYQPRERTVARHSGTSSTSPSKVVAERRECRSIAQQTSLSPVEMAENLKQDGALEASLDDNLLIENKKQAELLSCYTAHSKVVGFLWAVCRSIIPEEMLGCLRSWRALRSSIAHFVGLRRHEKFNVKHALFKLRLLSFPWLAFQCNENNTIPETPSGRVTAEERALQQRRLELWLHWLFTTLVVPLIRAHFYVTENENHRQDVFYYRKPVWARIRASGMRELTSKNFKKLSRHAVAQVLKSRELGFSQIRLLPKRAGLRPIANLAASSRGTLKFSVRTKRKATLCQVFGNISKELSLGDCRENDGGVLSLPHQSVSPVMNDMTQCTALIPYEASPSIVDAEGFAGRKKSPLVDLCLNKSSAATYGSSWSPSADKKRGSLIFRKSASIWERTPKSENYSFRSINSVLRDTHCCLKLEKEAHPEDLGSSVFGYCDVHRKVLPFILQLKESPNGPPRMFMAVCDVTKAYDNIPQEKLQEILEGFVHSSSYKVARYTCITPTLASVRVSHRRTCTLAEEPKKFVDSVGDLAKRSHCIFVDQAFSTSVRREKVLAMLREHVKENIVQIGSHFYQQKVGIPQGSVLSSLLCSLFYGHFDVHSLLPVVQSPSTEVSTYLQDTTSAVCERNRGTAEGGPCLTSSIAKAAGFQDYDDIERPLELELEVSDNGEDHFVESQPHVCNEANRKAHLSSLKDDSGPSCCGQGCEETGTFEKDSVLLRLIDDSFFISTSESGAKLFVESMHRGFKEYGCQANEGKTATSFRLQLGDKVLPRKVYKSEDGACFMRWSGLLVNCFTLEFQADYTRYCGEHIRSALTVRREKNQGWQLVLQMCQYMRPKCHALFFDPRINSPATIRLNAFQAFLLCAMKFHAYVCCLPHVTGMNEPFLYKAIDCAIRYMYGLLRHKMRSVGSEAEADFPYKELEWLAMIAFYRVLKRKQSRYPILLNMLRTKLQLPKYANMRACPPLSSAIDEKRSSMFKFIKY
ncbi:unnamed protein product [Calypogeia fissa]